MLLLWPLLQLSISSQPMVGISGSQLAWIAFTSIAITVGVFVLLVVRDRFAPPSDDQDS